MLHAINNIAAINNSYPDIYIYLVMTLLSAAFIYMCARMSRDKRRCMELESYISDLEKVLAEFRDVRHQYNNMLQNVVSYIENGEWDLIRDFKSEILDKTSILNKNNMVQIIKIKNYKIRSSILGITEACAKNGVDFSIAVSGEINFVYMDESAFCRVIGIIFNCILLEVMRSSKKEIRIEACSDNEGISLIIESTIDSSPEAEKIYTIGFSQCKSGFCKTDTAKKILEKNKNVIFNNYIHLDRFRQEIMILKKH